MAVIKIVPMPGAEGQQGETGAVGPQGPQGDTGATGPAGADAVWYYNGEYNPGASYVVGDVVTYDGQLWYRKNANGGNVGDTPSEGLFWDLLAAKGQDATPIISSGTWDPEFLTQSNLTAEDYEVLNADYYTVGDLVNINLNIRFRNVTSLAEEFPNYSDSDGNVYSTSMTWRVKFPFHPFSECNLYGVIRDSSSQGIPPESDWNPNTASSRILVARVLDTTSPLVGIALFLTPNPKELDTYPDPTYGGLAINELVSVSAIYPSNFTENNDEYYSSIQISGTYRRA
ncbi:MAG: hypothetical protein ACK5P0_00040 [bacterium]|jgi:hypothetical protein